LSTQIEKKTKEEEIQELKQSTRTASQPFRRELDVNVAELRNKLLARIDNVCMLYRQFTWRDIEVVQLNEEIARLKKEIHETIQKSVEKYSDKIDAPLRMQLIKLEKLQLELAVINHSLNTFNSILEAHNESVKSEPSQQVLRERLLREINNNREIYELLAQQIQGTKIRESAQQKEAKMRYQILEPPKRPLERIKPNRRRILFAALLLGGMLGMGVAVGSETLDLSIKYPEEVEDFLNVPVLATIPKMTPITKSLKMQRA
ncbi:hypothetical protein JW992_14565, partial [candidate division KSB1 bacterium]|nr:hypothetical protein [candidate division KSB1 bacterium]